MCSFIEPCPPHFDIVRFTIRYGCVYDIRGIKKIFVTFVSNFAFLICACTSLIVDVGHVN